MQHHSNTLANLLPRIALPLVLFFQMAVSVRQNNAAVAFAAATTAQEFLIFCFWQWFGGIMTFAPLTLVIDLPKALSRLDLR